MKIGFQLLKFSYPFALKLMQKAKGITNNL